jgi:hypothetical protein
VATDPEDEELTKTDDEELPSPMDELSSLDEQENVNAKAIKIAGSVRKRFVFMENS